MSPDAERKETDGIGGWSLMELVVVLAIIAILAAIITPMITSYVDRARISSARNDVRNIGAAIISFNSDTRSWPIYKTLADIPNGAAYDALETVGDIAAINGGLTTGTQWLGVINSNGDLRAIVNDNSLGLATTGARRWNGAYMNDINTDPWGTKYYFNALQLKPGGSSAAFVISAGPDKTIDTEFTQLTGTAFIVGGDDIVQRIR